MNRSSVGLTQDAGWQAGARRTYHVDPSTLWSRVISAAGQGWLEGAAEALGADSPGVTTFVPGSHYRRQVPGPSGVSSMLQVRVVAATRGRATLVLHRDQLTSEDDRVLVLEAMHRSLDRFTAIAPPDHR